MGLDIHQYFYGSMQNCQYILTDTDTHLAALVDPAWDVPALLSHIEALSCDLALILCTHGHFDHIHGVAECLTHTQVPVYLSSDVPEKSWPQAKDLRFTKQSDSIALGNHVIQVKHTPGHSPGDQCFYAAPHLITGDTLFIDGCGRCDLEGSDVEKMYHSLEWIKSLPNDTLIYPGHDYANQPTDTLISQKQTNRFLTCTDKETFIRKRLSV